MTLSITISELRAAEGSDLDDRIAALSRHLGRTPEDDEPVSLSVWAKATWDVAGLLLPMRYCWDRGGRAVCVEVACRAADRAIANARTEDIPVLRAAVDAARGCVAGTVTVEACQDAAHAAYAAAHAAFIAKQNNASFFTQLASLVGSFAVDAAHAVHCSARAAFLADYAAASFYASAAAYGAREASYNVAAERAAQRRDLLALLAKVGP
jgi:hypothetical protein